MLHAHCEVGPEAYAFPAPLLDAVDNDYQDVFWNGSLWHQSPYKDPPTPKWIGTDMRRCNVCDCAMLYRCSSANCALPVNGLVSVTADELKRAGYEANSVQLPAAAGGGYLASATGTHHIHCLYFIWQDHHIYSYPDVQAKKLAAGDMYDRHYEHCIDYSRQGIICNYDMTMIAYNWVGTHDNPTPNGNNEHKCMNWNKLQGWLKDRAVEMPPDFHRKLPAEAESLDYNP